MNPKIAKMVVKGAIGLSVSALIGSMIKSEKAVGELIDAHFNNKINSAAS